MLIVLHRIIHRIADKLVSPDFYKRYVHLPPDDIVPLEIQNNPKLFPYFENCRGATDGTHIGAFVPTTEQARFRSRKGTLTQNVLAMATFDGRFAHLLPGWEGSASDGALWLDARGHDLRIKPGNYYLGDAGFLSCDSLLVPYRAVRYHLKEWARSDKR